MVVGILRYWSYLAFHKDMDKLDKNRNDYFLDKIITKFNESLIKTEKLYSRNDLFAFRLNYKERVICTVSKFDDKDCLVILEVLPNHEYHNVSVRYQNQEITVELLPKDIVACSETCRGTIKNDEHKLPILPKICCARINNKTMIVGKNQLEILEKEVYQPTIFKIIGVAGSGKTTIAELLIYKNLDDDKNILYVTKSEWLVADVKNKYEKALTSIIAENYTSENVPKVTFSAYSALCSGLIFEKLFSDDNFQKYNAFLCNKEKYVHERENPSYKDVLGALSKTSSLDSDDDICDYLSEKLFNQKKFMEWIQNVPCFQKYAGSEKLRIGREVHEDIHKLGDKSLSASTNNLGKKESYGHSISSEVFKLYTKHLHDTGSLDLSLIDPTTEEKCPIYKQERYEYIIVDEAQDFRKSELNYVTTFSNKSGSIYIFMDSNQSLLDDFNLTSQYVQELSNESGRILEQYRLSDAFRMPGNITKIASIVLQIKREIIGGGLNKDELVNINPVEDIEKEKINSEEQLLGDSSSPGYVGWIELSNQTFGKERGHQKNADILTNLRSEAARSIELAIIIPTKSILKDVKETFPDGVIYIPEEAKGLEFQKIVLFNFFSGNYSFNYLNDRQTFLPVSDFSKNTNFPKDTERAKEMGKHSQFFSNLFIAITRTTNSLYFIESNEETKASSYFKEKFEEYTSKGEQVELEETCISEILGWIKDNRNKLVPDKLLDYCRRAYDKIKVSIESLEASTVSNFDDVGAAECLWNIIEIINILGNTISLEAHASLIDDLKKLVRRLLNHVKEKDWIDARLSGPLYADHDTILDDKKYTDSHLVKVVNTPGETNKSALYFVTQQKHYDLAFMLLHHGGDISSLTVELQRNLLRYSKLSLAADKLLNYFQVAHDNIKTYIESSKCSNFDDADAAGYFWYLVEIIHGMGNTRNAALNYSLTLLESLKKLLERLLNNFKDIDIGDTILSKPLHIHHETGNTIFDDRKYSDSYLIKLVNMKDGNGKSALYYFSQQKNYDLACILLRYGADISSISIEQQRNLLRYSAHQVHYDRGYHYQQDHELRPVVALLAINVPEAVLDYPDDYEYPRLLSNFCLNAHTKVIASLLNAINDQARKMRIINNGDNNITPIDSANSHHSKLSDYDHLQIIKYLVEHGAYKVMNGDPINNTLQSAACQGHLETFKYLVNKGNKDYFNAFIGIAAADNHVNIVEYLWQNYRQYTTNSSGETALHDAAYRGRLPSIKYLCENGADVNAVNRSGVSPLDYAIERNTMDVIKYLALEHNAEGVRHKEANRSNLHKYLSIENADINNIIDKSGNNLLHDAIKLGEIIFVKHLVTQGIDVNRRNVFGITPFHLAVQNYDDSFTELLLKNGAMYDIPTEDNKTALDLANYSNIQIVRIVDSLFQSSHLIHDLDNTISMFAYNSTDPMVFLINARNRQGQTLLHKAAALSDKDATLSLLKYNRSYIDKIITHATAKDYVPIDISLQDYQGNTPLHLAAACGNVEIVNALIEENANVTLKNNSGHTPSFIAGLYGHYKIVDLLLEKMGGPQNIKTENELNDVENSTNTSTKSKRSKSRKKKKKRNFR